jgi:hypothetical protein
LKDAAAEDCKAGFLKIYGGYSLAFCSYYHISVNEECLNASQLPNSVLCAVGYHGIEFIDSIRRDSPILTLSYDHIVNLAGIDD